MYHTGTAAHTWFQHPATKKFDLSHCHFAVAGAAPVSPELTEQFRRVLPNITFGQAYGKNVHIGSWFKLLSDIDI